MITSLPTGKHESGSFHVPAVHQFLVQLSVSSNLEGADVCCCCVVP